jgi:hypothetical protein
MNKALIGFVLKPVLAQLDNLLLSKPLSPTLQETSKFLQIKASIEEVGLIEPLTISPDGHPNSPVYGHLKLPHLN